MKRIFILLSLVFLTAGQTNASIIDAPHNETNNIVCVDCHKYSLWWQYSPFLSDSQLWETKTNAVCLTCHGDSGPEITESTHASSAMGTAHRSDLGEWSRACVDCHDPHFQAQLNWNQSVPDDDLYLVTGTIVPDSLVVIGDGTPQSPYYSTFTYQDLSTKDGWNNATTSWAAKSGTVGRGLILSLPQSSPDNTFEITEVDEGMATLTVSGRLDSRYDDTNTQFGLIYGQLIRDQIAVDGQMADVKFFDPKGGFVNIGDNDGICQVCHTNTLHFRNTGEINATGVGYDHTSQVTANCTDCHPHPKAFSHGGGSSSCVQCHGHDAGTIFDPDMTKTASPYVPNPEGIASIGAGTSQSHSTHTEMDSDDQRGPALYCASCHDLNNMPKFKNQDGTGGYTLAETDVCNICHSPDGTYDGVNDPAIGAKANWHDGIYDNNDNLKSGKEKWCATCHDESPSVIQGVSAPNVIGDEDGAYTYGTGWGFYKTGHGLTADETFPSKGGVETLSGRPVECNSCHDYATAHIDGLAQTFDDGDVFGLDPAIYRQGYRLKLIDGQEPYLMPRPSNIGNNSDQFRVCFQSGCHDSGPFTDSANMNTNMVTKGINRHVYHLNFNNQEMAAADWSGAHNSRMTCVVCHNVHGSTQLAMVRDGKLIDREIGSWIWYKNDATTYIYTNTSKPPEPDDVPLSASDGTAWLAAKSVNLCSTCHAWNIRTTDRIPFQNVAQAPLLEWVGTSGLISNGVAPDSAVGNSTFAFMVSYSDINNDTPSTIEVWIDLDDSNTYDDTNSHGETEKFAMVGTEATDTNIVDGKIYTKSLTIAKAVGSDGILNYRFYANDGGLDATGDPTADSTLTVTNNSPVLTWTEESYFETDGVHPNIGGNGADYQFRVTYTDVDGECPPDPNNGDIQVVVDGISYNLDNNDGAACNTGRIYSTTIPLSSASPPQDLTYTFTATDGTGTAVGNPTLNNTLTVQVGANNPPQLDWVAESCTTDGVKPALGLATAPFVFKVMYTDIEGTAPSSIEIWVDLNDNDAVDAGEKQPMSLASGDGNYTNGEIYAYTWILNEADAGDHKYAFFAKDTSDIDAVGEPTVTSGTRTVEVVSTAGANGVRQGLSDTGPIWYSSIQAAIDAVNGAHSVLVYEGTYNEDVLFQFGSNDSNTSLRSVCGPDTTIINGSGSSTVVTFSRHSKSQIDGFQVVGGTRGIAIEGTEVTINNCQVHDNNGPNGGGISVYQSGDMPTLTLTNSEIYNNSSDRGGGVRIWRGSGHTISHSIIRNNTITGDSAADGGGGIHLSQIADVTISNSVIKDNVSANSYAGGGLYVSQVPVPDTVGAGLLVSDSIISGNTSGSSGGGIYSDLSQISFVRSSIIGNTATSKGGALARPSAGNTASFENCILADNQAAQAGMAYLNGGTLDIINSTIANNRATVSYSGAIYSQLGIITIRNSILWGNQAATVGHIASFNGGSMTITDSIIQSGDDGNFTNAPFFTGNVIPVVSGFASEDDPWFVGNGDYHIQPFSPAIDNASATYAPADDIDGDSRPQGIANDIGADEVTP